MRPLVYSDTITVRTDAGLRAAIEAAAEREGSSASQWVRRAVASIVSRPSEPPPPSWLPVPRPKARRARAMRSPSSLRFLPVLPGALPKVWPQVEGWLERVCRRPGCDVTASDLRGICEREEGALAVMIGEGGWPVAAAVMQVRDHQSGRRVLWIYAAGGARAREWLSVLEMIEDSATDAGCTSVEFVGRSGWKRLLSDYATEPCEAGLHFSKSLGA